MEKTCIFYASKYHLSLILLKLLSNEKVKKYTVITFLEDKIIDEINDLKKKYKLKENTKNEVDYNETKTIGNKLINKDENIIFIIEGNKQYYKEVNDFIIQNVNKLKIKNAKIINCYNFEMNKDETKEILKENQEFLSIADENYLTNFI